jgi:hypothetical protein
MYDMIPTQPPANEPPDDNGFDNQAVLDPTLFDYVEIDERTTPQIYGQFGTYANSELINRNQANYKTYREMRTDPTIAFARMLCVAPLVTVGWAYDEKEGAPAGAKEFIEEQLAPWRIYLMKAIMEGYIDYGWTPFEMVSCIDDGRIKIRKFKQLIQDQTLILVEKTTGEYIGLRQYNYNTHSLSNAGQVDLSIYDSLHIALDVEGTNWYGRALMENARAIYTQWNVVNESANKYDLKIAGASWVVHYPVGKSDYNGVKKVDNYDIAQDFLGQLVSNGKLAVPRQVAQFVTDANAGKTEKTWEIELISDKGVTQAGFIDRQKYLDALKVRAFGMPERAVLEGQYGTKAEASAHADFAITTFEMRHQVAVEQINKQVVKFLLEANYGESACGCIVIKPRPLVDEKRMLLEKIYTLIITNPDGLMSELQSLDMQTFRKQLDLPENPVSALGSMPAAQGLLTDYFNELHGQQQAAGARGSVTGPALGPIPPEYWQEMQNVAS